MTGGIRIRAGAEMTSFAYFAVMMTGHDDMARQ
jgi:hypothetical protein